MYLKSLEIQGFKSFPDKTVLHFDRGMTAVVGPNGSGKSNISDAVKWVLGEQSTKNLRSSKMEDVIFSGTASRKALGFAEVTLRLDNSDGSFRRDEKEISVTRRYYRSGDSEYLLNGETARLRDINELFMDTGLGRDGYSMVGQGRIEDLVSGKSAERRDIFEEAAGISHLRYKKTDAVKRLAASEENLVRLRDILGELEGRVGPLQKQSEKAKKYLVLAEERRTLEIGLWLNTLEKSTEKIREHGTRIEIATNQHTAISEELDHIFKNGEAQREKAADITVEIEKLRSAAAETDEQAAMLEGTIAVCRNSIEYNGSAIERANREKTGEAETDRHFSERLGFAKSETERLTGLLSEKDKLLADKNAELIEIFSSDGDNEKEVSELELESEKINDSISAQSITKSSAETALAEITERLKSFDSDNAANESEAESLRQKVGTLEESLSKNEEDAASCTNTVSGYKLMLDTKAAKAEQSKKACEAKGLDIDRILGKIRMLEEMEKNMDGYAGSVKSVMREQKNGRLHGMHGTVSMLISTDAEYSVAIETALGGAIQNIVTDTEEDAKKAMKFLRDTSAGRATFLPLTAIKGRPLEEKGLDDCYGFIDLASNLVKADAKYRQITESLLGRTVIAQDIDCAVTMAKKYGHRFKIVTLDGQVINAGGSMTGGSRITNSGFLSRSGEIDKLKKELEKSRTEQEALLQTSKRAAAELAKITADMQGAEAELYRLREEKVRIESELKIAKSQLDALDKALGKASREKSESEIRTAELKKSLTELDRELAKLKLERAEIIERREKLALQRRSIFDRRDKINAEIAAINLEKTTIQKDIEAHKNDIESLESRRLSHSERSRALDEEIASLNAENDKLRSQIEDTSKQIKALRDESENISGSITALAEKRNLCEAESARLRLAEKEKGDEKERIAGELIRLEERRAALIKEQEDIEKRLYEEYHLTRREAMDEGIEIGNVTEAEKRLRELRAQIRALGTVNVGAIDEYKEVSERYEFLSTQIGDVEKTKAELEKMIDELTSKMSKQFREQFAKINEYFKQSFTDLFGGGNADLILEDESNCLECAIDIKAQPPGKNVKSISLLSGGEKGLCAIALLFAILKLNPAPFCFFDEVEAALDDVNVTKYAQYIRTFTDKTQFILITHRRGSMEEADVLYGVTMQEEGVSKLLKLETSQLASDKGLE